MITGAGDPLAAIVTGRIIAGIGVGFESAIVILYMSEIVSVPQIIQAILKIDYQSSAQERSVVLSSQGTNSASPSALCLPLSSCTQLKIAETPDLTGFLSPSNLPGQSSWLEGFSLSQIHHATT